MSRTEAALTRTFRAVWGRCLATVARLTGDLDLAEDAVADAFATALRTWPARGVPDNPGAWITTTARNRARDRLRRERARDDKEVAAVRDLLPAGPDGAPGADGAAELDPVDDDQLRLVFTCCHPALAPPAQVGLTLRLVCGLSTAEIGPRTGQGVGADSAWPAAARLASRVRQAARRREVTDAARR